MKQTLFTVAIAMQLVLFTACKKENLEYEDNNPQKPTLEFDEISKIGCSAPGWAGSGGTCDGGGDATETSVSTLSQLTSAISQNKKVIRITQNITTTSKIQLSGKSNMTIYGAPGVRLKNLSTGQSSSGIFKLSGCSDMIIRNLIFEGPGAYDTDGGDNLALENSSRIWVDHCDFQDGVDGNLDITNGSNYISVTYCKFSYLKPPISGGSGGSNDHRFTNLIGSSDSKTSDRNKLKITFARCWWASGCKERMPRVRFGQVHVLNCYFNCSGNNECVAAGKEANIRIEKCYFSGVDDPIKQKSSNFTAYQNIGSTFNNCTGNTASSGTAFNPPYSIIILSASSVVSDVTGGAGATLTGNDCGF
jgi:pectate lyase